MRVLLVSFVGDNRWSGMGKWSHRVAEGLREEGHEPELWFADRFPRTLSLGRYSVLLFPLVLAWRLLLDRRRFDVLVVHEPSAFWCGVLRRLFGVLPPVVVMCHNVESKVHRRMLDARRRGLATMTRGAGLKHLLLRGWQTDGAIRLADAVICLSTEDVEYVREHLGRRENVTLMLNGADAENFFDSGRTSEEDEQVLFVGGWLDVKGRHVLPQIWRAVRRERADARLSVVGTGAGANAVLRAFDPLDRDSLRVVPQVADPAAMADEFRRHGIFLMPSLSEGSPLALLEAMAAALGIAASRVGGIPDLVEHERHALLYEAFDAEAAAASVLRLLGDASLRHGLGEAARERARGLRWRATAKQLAAVAEAAAAPRGPDRGEPSRRREAARAESGSR